MVNLNAPRKVIVIFIIAAVSTLLILAGIIFTQGKRITAQEQKLNAQQKFILAGVKSSSSSKSSLSQAKAEAQDLQTAIDKGKEKQASDEAEIARLKEEAEAARQAQNSSQERAATLEKDNQQLKAEVSGLKTALSENVDSEIKAPVKNGAAKQKTALPTPAELRKLQKQIDKLSEENKSAAEEKKGLIALNKQLKADNENLKDADKKIKVLNSRTEAKAKELFLQLKDKEQLQDKVAQLNGAVSVLTKERGGLLKNVERLKARTVDLEAENTLLYGKTGDAFMRAGITDEAIEAFNNAVRLNPSNADAHYKLGFLYKRTMDNNLMAVYHFRKYLALEPKSKNRKEIEYLIQMLSQYDWGAAQKN